MSTEKLIIFDTTMRDGEQSPGAMMTLEEKLRIARQLERMKVDVIEAGFPASSNGDFEAVKAVAKVIKYSVVAGLCRANDKDVQRGIDALKDARGPWRIHTFLATSELHMKMKLRMTPDQVFEQAKLAVRYAKNACPDVEFSPEDAGRSEPDFLCRVLEAVIKEGATTVNIPDTVGDAVPEPFGELIRKLRERIPNSDNAGGSGNKIVLGKLSGRTAFRQRLKELGIELDNEEGYNKAFQRFKDLADKKSEIFDEDLLALVAQEAGTSGEEEWSLVSMEQGSSTKDKPHASIVLLRKNSKIDAEAKGDGPVDATFKAIESVAKSGAELLLYSVNAVTQGTESQGEVTVRLSKGGRIVNGVGADTDIVVASAKAYISALNKLASKVERVNPQHQL